MPAATIHTARVFISTTVDATLTTIMWTVYCATTAAAAAAATAAATTTTTTTTMAGGDSNEHYDAGSGLTRDATTIAAIADGIRG